MTPARPCRSIDRVYRIQFTVPSLPSRYCVKRLPAWLPGVCWGGKLRDNSAEQRRSTECSEGLMHPYAGHDTDVFN